MKDALNRLEDILAKETELHAELLRLSDAKRQTIIEGDLDGMEETLAREREIVQQVEETEAERQIVVETLRKALRLGEGPVKLQSIIDRVDEARADRLKKIHNLLKDVIERLRYRSRQNAELMKASMEHVEAFLRAIAEACAPRRGYGRDGRSQAGAMSLLDRSA